MNVTPKLDHVNKETFIQDYLHACGVYDIDRYLNPDDSCFDNPFDYPNMDKAIELLKKHIFNKSKIAILVDEDADGYCSAAIAYEFLREEGINAIPVFHKSSKAHGIVRNDKEDIVKYIADNEINMLWCPDSSSNDKGQINELYSHGIDCLVTDHHLISTPSDNCVLINPFCKDGLNKNLSGAGVTYKVVQAYYNNIGIDAPNYKDLVAMSIVSDVCDLTSIENRAFLHFGLNNT